MDPFAGLDAKAVNWVGPSSWTRRADENLGWRRGLRWRLICRGFLFFPRLILPGVFPDDFAPVQSWVSFATIKLRHNDGVRPHYAADSAAC
jgi:hypothetical protein